MLYTQLLLNFQPKTELFVGLKVTVRSAVFAIFGVCVLMGGAAAASGLPDVTPQSVPDLKVEIMDMDGQSVTLADYHGAPLLVNFWAIWCPPCVAELPALERAVAPLEAQSVRVLLVSVDRGGAKKAVPFLEKHGVSSPELAFDPKGALSRHLAVRGLPTTFLLSADQTKSLALVGPPEWDMPQVQKDIQAFLSQ